MQNIEIIYKYFPNITDEQAKLFSKLKPLYEEWNENINVISRKDIDNLYEKHVLHSLAIAKFLQFKPNTKILDVGTGGGFPSIPLAILFPEVKITAIDSIGKKIKVVNEVINSLDLKNVTAIQARADGVKGKFSFVVGRAVTNLSDFIGWVNHKIEPQSLHAEANGIICLKGGDLEDEIDDAKNRFRLKEVQVSEVNLSKYFTEEYFETKKLVHIAI